MSTTEETEIFQDASSLNNQNNQEEQEEEEEMSILTAREYEGDDERQSIMSADTAMSSSMTRQGSLFNQSKASPVSGQLVQRQSSESSTSSVDMSTVMPQFKHRSLPHAKLLENRQRLNAIKATLKDGHHESSSSAIDTPTVESSASTIVTTGTTATATTANTSNSNTLKKNAGKMFTTSPRSEPVSSLSLPTTLDDTAMNNDNGEDSTDVVQPSSSSAYRVSIHHTNELRQTLESNSQSLESVDLGDDTEKMPLSKEEIALLVRLDAENSKVTAASTQNDTSSGVRDVKPSIISTSSRLLGSRAHYLNDVFASISSSPSKEISAADVTANTTLQAVVSPDSVPLKSGGSVDDGNMEQEADWEFWGKLLTDLESIVRKQNKLLVKKVHTGLPKAVRGTIWYNFSRLHPHSFLRLLNNHTSSSITSPVSPSSGSNNSPTREKFTPPEAFRNVVLEDAYVELLKLSSPYEKMIIRDLARTFPKHEFFKHADGLGQESLFNVMKAYSLYDPEVGYCQGLSFIVGALLLHMPDEQAFSCLVHLMHTYEFRGCFTPRMELLQLRLYQFDRLLQEVMPRVNDHLLQEGIRSTMYASQWFLTIFSYRFPLEVVFRIMDIIFATGVVSGVSGAEGGVMDAMMERMSESVAAVSGASQFKSHEVGVDVGIVLFRFALALLKKNEEMILALDFEPLLEFLKHGLFQIYTGFPNPSTGDKLEPGDVQMETLYENPVGSKSPSAIRHTHVPTYSINEIVKDAMSSQWKSLTKKKLNQLRKDYEEELKKTDPEYLAEKSLEAQNQRLTEDLKRSEKLLADLNKDHCELAGQLISVRIELAKEKEVQDALRRQIGDLKTILQQDISKYDKNELQKIIEHTVTSDNSDQTLPAAAPTPLNENERTPTMEEQVKILTRQNIQLIHEVDYWRTKHDDLIRNKQQPHNVQNATNTAASLARKLFIRTSGSNSQSEKVEATSPKDE